MRSYLAAVALWVVARHWNIKKVCLKKYVFSVIVCCFLKRNAKTGRAQNCSEGRVASLRSQVAGLRPPQPPPPTLDLGHEGGDGGRRMEVGPGEDSVHCTAILGAWGAELSTQGGVGTWVMWPSELGGPVGAARPVSV